MTGPSQTAAEDALMTTLETPTREFDDPFEIEEVEIPRAALEPPAKIKPETKAQMLARWQEAVDTGSFLRCRNYLAEAIEHLARKSASVGGGPQAVSTPRPFFEMVERHLGITFGIDLAAIGENALCADYFGPCAGSIAFDSLAQDWVACTGPSRWGWLNPPYSHVLPWVRKARLESERGARLVMLIKLAPGTKWYADEVDGKGCSVLKMRGRLKFPGYEHGAAFDTMIVAFGGEPFKEQTWDWRKCMDETEASK